VFPVQNHSLLRPNEILLRFYQLAVEFDFLLEMWKMRICYFLSNAPSELVPPNVQLLDGSCLLFDDYYEKTILPFHFYESELLYGLLQIFLQKL
jgi:hypothetical protein